MRSLLYTGSAALLAGGVILSAGQQGQGTTPAPWPLSNAVRERGSSITGAFEGWFYDKDGSQSLLVGYFNRNTKQELDIPTGPNNRIEPGGPDLGQPTHFLAGRQFGVFAIPVSKSFGAKELTWTIVANGQTNTITMHTRPDWIVEPFEDPANKNTPPVIRFDPTAASYTGPPVGIAATTRRPRERRCRWWRGRLTRGPGSTCPMRRRETAAAAPQDPLRRRRRDWRLPGACSAALERSGSTTRARRSTWITTGRPPRWRRSRCRASTSSGCRPTTPPGTAAADSSAAGRTSTSRSPSRPRPPGRRRRTAEALAEAGQACGLDRPACLNHEGTKTRRYTKKNNICLLRAFFESSCLRGQGSFQNVNCAPNFTYRACRMFSGLSHAIRRSC